MKKHMKRLVLPTVVGGFLLAGLVARVTAQTQPRIYLDPMPLTLEQVGTEASKTFDVVLEGVSESAGFQLELSFDKEVVQIDAADLLTPPTDVTLIPLKDIDNEKGIATFGIGVFCDDGVCPNILDGSPAVLATLTVSGVKEGTSNLEFDASYTLYGTELAADDDIVRIEATLAGGQVAVGEAEGPTVNLSRGWNRATLPEVPADFTSLSALESIQTSCANSAPAISRKKNGWWESAVYDYGGADFALSEGGAAYVRVATSCIWSP